MVANRNLAQVQEFLELLAEAKTKLKAVELAKRLDLCYSQIARWLSPKGCIPSKGVIERLLPKLQAILTCEEREAVATRVIGPATTKRTLCVDEFGTIISAKAEVSASSQTMQDLADYILELEKELDSIQAEMSKLQTRYGEARQELTVANQTITGLKAIYRKEQKP